MKNLTLVLMAVVLFLVGKTMNAQPVSYKFTQYSIENGLSHNQINCFLKDRKGFIWIGTMAGLNCFDGNSFKVYRHEIRDSLSIPDDFVQSLFEDQDGSIWVFTRVGISILNPTTGLFKSNVTPILKERNLPEENLNRIYKDKAGNVWYCYPRCVIRIFTDTKKQIRFENIAANKNTPDASSVSNVLEDGTRNYWFIHRNGVIETVDGQSNRVLYRNSNLTNYLKNTYNDIGAYIDKSNDLWIWAFNDPNGIFRFDHQQKTVMPLAPKIKISSNLIKGVTEDNNGNIWIGTDHGGLNIFNKSDNSLRTIVNIPGDNKSLSQNSINSMYKDDQGGIWVGTFKKGVSYYHESLSKVQLYKNHALSPESLPYDDVNCFAEDAKHNIWIGTNGGGLIYFDRAANKFIRYQNQTGNASSLPSNIIVSLYIDKTQKLWIGTYFGGLSCFENGHFTNYRHNAQSNESITDDRIWDILEDEQGNFWVATLGGGLDLFDRKKKTFTHYKTGDVNSVHSDYIFSLAQDASNNLWIGTSWGIDILEKQTGRFIHYLKDQVPTIGLSNNNVICLHFDSRNRMWVGTREGLNVFDPTTKTFQVFRKEDGLPDNTIQTIVEDKDHSLWISTSNGICNLKVNASEGKPITIVAKTYNESDGLQGRDFNNGAALCTEKGELVFGGANGFNLFKPEDIKGTSPKLKVVFTGLEIFNKPIAVGENLNGRVILDKLIDDSRLITLKHSENVFSIDFSALYFTHPEKVKYSYMLEGFNRTWLTTDAKTHKATYTNLSPGKYVFKVRASFSENEWSDQTYNLTIVVKPPFWLTKFAFFLYSLLIIGGIYLSRRMLLERERLKYRIEQETIEAQRRHDIDMMKLKLFTNISHEFRTPLSLIISPMEKLLKTTKDPESQRLLQTMQRNSKRLLNLVNQLLDFRRMEVQQFKFTPSKGEIVGFVREITFSFADFAEKKNIRLKFNSDLERLEAWFDSDKLEKILFNLLSNAFKFTREQGAISVKLAVVEDTEPNTSGIKLIRIKVKDTGIGIAADKHDKIFDGFFQDENQGAIINAGSGIGLALTKEFVKLHGGSILVDSELDKGSEFTILLPMKDCSTDIALKEENIEIENNTPLKSDDDESGNISENVDKKPVLLLVEDNEDFRFYLKDNLSNEYFIIEAANGREGWSKAVSNIPDLVVSDIIMSEMTGIQLCKKVKNDQRTSHIPVILLTSKNSEEQKLEGLEAGADDYITKPFIFEILEIRIKKLVEQRQQLQNRFQKQIEIKPSEISITSLDEKLIMKAVDLVEKQISNPDFSVEDLSRECGMSRVHLYKKLLSLTGKTPIEFIRIIRLKRAAQLLEKSQLNVSEIAYETGFNNPKYFAKYFKAEFNMLPSVYAETVKKKDATSIN